MFQKYCTFAPSNKNDDRRSLILGYGVMVTQQILVLFFLVRVRVAQLHLQRSRGEDKALLGYGVMVTQQILVLFFLVRVRVAQQKKRYGIIPLFLLSVDTCPFQSGYTDWHYLLTFFFPVR